MITNARRKLRRIVDKLQDNYPVYNLNNQTDPTDETIFIILTTQTNHPKFFSSWQTIRNRFRDWNDLLQAGAGKELATILKPAGLSQQKSSLIIGLAHKLHKDHGAVDLSFLDGLPTEECEKYLLSLPGLGTKTARCILMYTLGRNVFPLDTHCYRIMRRLGILDGHLNYSRKTTHNYSQQIVYPRDRFRLHVLMVQHGRMICKTRKPKCDECSLSRSCRNKGMKVRI